jgi:hypothetical protein
LVFLPAFGADVGFVQGVRVAVRSLPLVVSIRARY